MSTPRRSSRLKAKDQENQQKLELLRCERRRKGRKTEFLSSDSDEAEVDGTSSECESSSGRERPVVNVERTPKVNNFIRVYNSYNRDFGLDCYEHDFIDDSETSAKHGKKVRRGSGRGSGRRKRRKNQSGVESSDTEDGEGRPEELQRMPHTRRRSRCGQKRIYFVDSSSGKDSEREVDVDPRRGCSASGSEDDPVIVSGHRKRAQVESGSESSDSGREGGKRRKKYRKPECDEEISPDASTPTSRYPSSRAEKLRQQKEKKNKEMLRKLRMQRARQRGASNKVDDDASDSDGRPSDDQSKATSGTEEGVDNGGVSHPSPTEELAQILFPESESSGEESGWIVSDSEDMTTSLAGMLEGTAGHERTWETSFSILHLFSPTVEAVNIESWLYGAEMERDANTVDENGLCPLIYAAGCAHAELFKSLLQQTNLSTVHSILKGTGTTLLHVIVEAPLGSGGTEHEHTHSLQTPCTVSGSGGYLDSSVCDSEEEMGVPQEGDVKPTLTDVADHQEYEEEKRNGAMEAPPPTCRSTVEAPSPTCRSTMEAPPPTCGSTMEAPSPTCRSTVEAPPPTCGSTTEAPSPTCGSTMEVPSPTHGITIDNDSASLQCLRSLQNYDSSHFGQLLAESCERHPTILEMAVRYCKPQCLEFLVVAGVSPLNCGFTGDRDDSETGSVCSEDAIPPPSPLPPPSLLPSSSLLCPPSLLHQAVLCQWGGDGGKSVDILEKLLPQLSTELELVDSQGNTPLMLAADVGHSAALSVLLEHGANINCRDPSGGTSPLHLAALSGWIRCVEVLISHGHPVDCRDAKGWPPLLYAHFEDHQDCVLALMKAKPGQLSVLSDLLRRTPDDGTDAKKKTAKVVRTLLVSLAHHEAYFSLFNEFVGRNPNVLEDDGFEFMKHCMALLNFENKQVWFRRKLWRLRAHASTNYTGLHSLALPSISRHNLLQSTYNKLDDVTAIQCWLQPLHVTFEGEAGICSGPRREFWSCFSRALANEEKKVFHSCDDGQLSLQPCVVFSKYCKALTSNAALADHMKLLHWVGMMVASAVFHGDTVSFNLTKPLIKQLLGSPLTHPADLEDVDREFYHCLTMWLQSEGISDLELTFTCTLLCPWDGQSIDAPLMEDGRSKSVSEDNKQEYVNQVSHFKLEAAMQEELHSFLSGFWKVIPRRCMQVFTPNEFSLILSGVPRIDVEDWQRNTEYHGLSALHKIMVWFWRLVKSLKEEEKALLLKFATGSPRVPAGGFASLQGLCGPTKFSISLISGVDKIPHASTCFNNLKLSMYSCEQELRDKVLIAIRYGCEGFEFS